MEPDVLIYADGSSLGNPGPGGWGVIIARKDKVLELGGGNPHTTNNRMELTAAIEALSRVGVGESAVLRTDSRYVMNGITKWAAGWAAAGWRGKNKKKILNEDLWKELLKAAGGKAIAWEHVHGHAGVAGNERVDFIATRCAKGKRFRTEEFWASPLSKYPHDIWNLGETKRRPSKKKNQGKAYSYLSLVDGVLVRHGTWKECEARVKGVSGAKFKKALSKEDEKEILRRWGIKTP